MKRKSATGPLNTMQKPVWHGNEPCIEIGGNSGVWVLLYCITETAAKY